MWLESLRISPPSMCLSLPSPMCIDLLSTMCIGLPSSMCIALPPSLCGRLPPSLCGWLPPSLSSGLSSVLARANAFFCLVTQVVASSGSRPCSILFVPPGFGAITLVPGAMADDGVEAGELVLLLFFFLTSHVFLLETFSSSYKQRRQWH